MAIRISDHQLDEFEQSHEPALIVHCKRTRKKYALLPKCAYEQVRPLLLFFAPQDNILSQDANGALLPAEETNGRRIELINKKYDVGLTSSEKKELAALNCSASEFRDEASGSRSRILDLILAGLKLQNSRPTAD